MMVNCPKCGFSQPKDRYCASCGVDMVAFKPAQKPLATRILTSTGFQVAALSLIVIAITVSVRGRNQAELAKQQEQLSQTQNLASAYSEESEAARTAGNAYAEKVSEESKLARERAELEAANAASQVAAETETADTTSTTSAQTASFASTAPTPTVSPTPAAPSGAQAADLAKAVSIYFVEIPRGAANALLANAKQAGSDGQVLFGVVSEAQKRLARLRNVRPVDGPETQAIRLNQPRMLFKGVRDPASGQNLGFTLQAVAVANDDTGTHLQIDANRALKDAASGIESVNLMLPESFTVPKRSAVLIMGALPHRPLIDGEQQLYRTSNVLRLMTSNQFRQGATDLAIVVETK